MSSIGQKIDHLIGFLDEQTQNPKSRAKDTCIELMQEILRESPSNISEEDRGKLYARISKLDVEQLMQSPPSHLGNLMCRVSSIFNRHLGSELTGEDLRVKMLEKFAPPPTLQLNFAAYQANSELPKNYFQIETNRVVDKTADRIEQEVRTNGNLQSCFHFLVEDLGAERQGIACKQGSKSLRSFGTYRRETVKKAGDYGGVYTHIGKGGQYEEYGKKIRQSLMSKFCSFGYGEAPRVIREETCHGYTSRFEICDRWGKGKMPSPDGDIGILLPISDWFMPKEDVFYMKVSLEKDGKIYSMSRYYVKVNPQDLESSSNSSEDLPVVIEHQREKDMNPTSLFQRFFCQLKHFFNEQNEIKKVAYQIKLKLKNKFLSFLIYKVAFVVAECNINYFNSIKIILLC